MEDQCTSPWAETHAEQDRSVTGRIGTTRYVGVLKNANIEDHDKERRLRYFRPF